MLEIIKKKRDGHELSQEEIQEVIDGLVSGAIPDYQLAAFLMAIYFRGMNEHETAMLTDAVLRSGDQIDLSEIEGIKVDKHSTGGVGDKTTLVLAPLVAAAGVPVAKMSGRGLGHTGGTLDKLESIEGFSVNLTKEEFIAQVKAHNIAICGQNENLVPADKKLYALRDVTATVDNPALITASIMSKKLVCGADAIVIDMKIGEGAYMKTVDDAERLGSIMINTARRMQRDIIIVVSAMDQPLGYAIGNALEIKEVIDTLKGNGPEDLTGLCLELGANMLLLSQKVGTLQEGKNKLDELIKSGAAFDKFKELVNAQGGNLDVIDNPELLPVSQFTEVYSSAESGYITDLNALEIGKASVLLGAGRETRESKLDYGAGIVLHKKRGAYVERGEILAVMYSDNRADFKKALPHLVAAYEIGDTKGEKHPIIIKTMK